MTTCTHHLGTLPCDRPAEEHKGNGLGCTHTASWFPDVHTDEVRDD